MSIFSYNFTQCIPCMARREVLEHLKIGMDEETTAVAELTMSNGQVYNIHVRNKADRCFFEGPSWITMAAAQGFQGGHGEKIWLSFGSSANKFTVRYTGAP